MTEKRKKPVIFSRTVSLKGGSYVVAIPAQIKEHLGLKAGQQLFFKLDSGEKNVKIGTEQTLGVRIQISEPDETDADFVGLKFSGKVSDIREALVGRRKKRNKTS